MMKINEGKMGCALSALFLVTSIAVQAQNFQVAYRYSDLLGNPNSGLVILGTSIYGSSTFLTECRLCGSGGLYELNAKEQVPLLGGISIGSPIADSRGNLYGAVYSTSEIPEVVQMSQIRGIWNQPIVLYSFPVDQFGFASLQTPLTMDASGNLYGASYAGGADGVGFVFELTPGGGGWNQTTLYNFTGNSGSNNNCTLSGDGCEPNGGLAIDHEGNVYGTTIRGGAFGRGTVFKLMPGSDGWTETILHSFNYQNGNDGALPETGVVLDVAGNAYGIALGSTSNQGIVYEITFPSLEFTSIHVFEGSSQDGASPSSLRFDGQGSLWGTTWEGGINNSLCGTAGCGTLFELQPSSSGWQYSIIHDFAGYPRGSAPDALIFDGLGRLWGTTQTGGRVEGSTQTTGTLYMIVPSSEIVSRPENSIDATSR